MLLHMTLHKTVAFALQKLTFYSSKLWSGGLPNLGKEVSLSCEPYRAIVHDKGMLLINAANEGVIFKSVLIS